MWDVNSLAEITRGVAASWRLVEIQCEWISAAKQNEGLHHGDFTQALWEKGQQFKQEIRHHNPITSVGYLIAAAFFRWRRSRVASRFCCDAIKMLVFKYGISHCHLLAKWCSVEQLLNLVLPFLCFASGGAGRPQVHRNTGGLFMAGCILSFLMSKVFTCSLLNVFETLGRWMIFSVSLNINIT